ncbi:DNA primase [Streptomyces violaceusniger]|uniref:Bifunctional DNA primase/polymerase n=2 Tax=Streptomyces violaceusniger group TaxID=2839105 RepID=A0ABD5JKM3_9ACTN|nr:MULTISPECIES: bifunctional DNA primase/polymerase [Streptomyces]KUL65140.1 DNA primase [Streptomyces violaceusniger]MEE4588998.1 bifunctional DNA primase/polymerase [Streptomyces sp. DSM 41602]RSS42631.1 DNA primase [Streptomyces sp. WAC05858]
MANPALAHVLAHALTAAAHGFRVIPLTRAKLPAVRSPHHHDPGPPPCRGECGRLGHGVHDASADPEAIRALFAAAPWATGYGIACGRAPYHLIGLDLDLKSGSPGSPRGTGGTGATDGRAGTRKPGASGKDGTGGMDSTDGLAADGLAALARLARDHAFAIPPTVTVLTPSGGRHLWLCGPSGLAVPNSAGRLAPGIDIRGLGGYLVGPGSYGSHGSYRLAPGSPAWAPAPAPAALLRLLTPPRPAPHRSYRPGPPSPGPRPAALEGLVRFVRASREGQRNVRLFWAACRAYESGAGPELAPALIEAALDTGLAPREARATVASAARSSARHLQPPDAWA